MAGSVDVYGAVAGGHICIGYVPQRSQVDWTFPVTVADVVLMGRVARIGLFRQAGQETIIGWWPKAWRRWA